MFAASLDKPSQVSFKHAKRNKRPLIETQRILFREKIREKNRFSHGHGPSGSK